MNCNFQGFPAEYCLVGKKPILVLNAVKGFNVLADECSTVWTFKHILTKILDDL